MSFENKVILVTGASSGIGAGAARHMAKLGGRVALVGRNEVRLNKVADQIKNDGSQAPLTIVADVTIDAERIINETIQHFGKLDVLVNSAGIAKTKPFVESDIDLYDKIMNTNVRSIVSLTKTAVPHLEATKGNIVNVSSVAGLVVIKNMSYYCMSKSALDKFSCCAAVELGSKGIRVNSINVGIVNTPIFEASGVSDEQKQQILNDLASKYPVGRYGETSDTSAAISYLASDSASFITGTLLSIDGGAVVAAAY